MYSIGGSIIELGRYVSSSVDLWTAHAVAYTPRDLFNSTPSVLKNVMFRTRFGSNISITFKLSSLQM
jgi:hypothetical protein